MRPAPCRMWAPLWPASGAQQVVTLMSRPGRHSGQFAANPVPVRLARWRAWAPPSARPPGVRAPGRPQHQAAFRAGARTGRRAAWLRFVGRAWRGRRPTGAVVCVGPLWPARAPLGHAHSCRRPESHYGRHDNQVRLGWRRAHIGERAGDFIWAPVSGPVGLNRRAARR